MFQQYIVFLSQIDLKKMPLGKLTKRQIESAYAVLGEAQKVSEKLLKFERRNFNLFTSVVSANFSPENPPRILHE